jgi:flagellar biosynthetic protein FliS
MYIKIMNQDSVEKYKLATVKNSDTANQMLFVFDESIKLLHLAKKALAEKNLDSKHNILMKIVDTFIILRSGVNTEAGEIIVILDQFYENVINKIHQINIKSSNPDDIDVVIDSIKNVRNSIKEAQAISDTNQEEIK